MFPDRNGHGLSKDLYIFNLSSIPVINSAVDVLFFLSLIELTNSRARKLFQSWRYLFKGVYFK